MVPSEILLSESRWREKDAAPGTQFVWDDPAVCSRCGETSEHADTRPKVNIESQGLGRAAARLSIVWPGNADRWRWLWCWRIWIQLLTNKRGAFPSKPYKTKNLVKLANKMCFIISVQCVEEILDVLVVFWLFDYVGNIWYLWWQTLIAYLTLNSGLSWILEKLLEAYLQVSRLVRHCASHRAVVHTTSTLCTLRRHCASPQHQMCTVHVIVSQVCKTKHWCW